MAVKAFVTVVKAYVGGPDEAPEVYVDVHVSAHDGEVAQGADTTLGPIAQSNWATINLALRNAARAYVTAQWGISFGLLDSVALFGAAELL